MSARDTVRALATEWAKAHWPAPQAPVSRHIDELLGRRFGTAEELALSIEAFAATVETLRDQLATITPVLVVVLDDSARLDVDVVSWADVSALEIFTPPEIYLVVASDLAVPLDGEEYRCAVTPPIELPHVRLSSSYRCSRGEQAARAGWEFLGRSSSPPIHSAGEWGFVSGEPPELTDRVGRDDRWLGDRHA